MLSYFPSELKLVHKSNLWMCDGWGFEWFTLSFSQQSPHYYDLIQSFGWYFHNRTKNRRNGLTLCYRTGDVPGDRAEGRQPVGARPGRWPAAGWTGSCGIPAGSGWPALLQTGAPEGQPGRLPAAAAGPTGRGEKHRTRTGTTWNMQLKV